MFGTFSNQLKLIYELHKQLPGHIRVAGHSGGQRFLRLLSGEPNAALRAVSRVGVKPPGRGGW